MNKFLPETNTKIRIAVFIAYFIGVLATVTMCSPPAYANPPTPKAYVLVIIIAAKIDYITDPVIDHIKFDTQLACTRAQTGIKLNIKNSRRYKTFTACYPVKIEKLVR